MALNRSDWIIIGISGVTCGGKTSLANRLKHTLSPVHVFHQDKYFFPDDSPKHIKCDGLEHNNYDILSALDMEAMHQDMCATLRGQDMEAMHQDMCATLRGQDMEATHQDMCATLRGQDMEATHQDMCATLRGQDMEAMHQDMCATLRGQDMEAMHQDMCATLRGQDMEATHQDMCATLRGQDMEATHQDMCATLRGQDMEAMHQDMCATLRGQDMEAMHQDMCATLRGQDMEATHQDMCATLRGQGKAHEAAKDNGQQKFTVQGKRFLIAEGFTVLNYKPIMDMCDLRYYFVLEYGECVMRRSHRLYDPPDVVGYFDTCVWPEHIKYRAEIEQEMRVKIIDGTQGNAFEIVMADLRAIHT